MINNFLIIKYIGKDDKIGFKINKDFFVHNLENKKNNRENLVNNLYNLVNNYKIQLDKNFSVIVNLGPGSFSAIRISISAVKGLEISKKIKIFGYKDTDLKEFDQKNVEKLIKKNLIEKKLIKPIYLS